MVRLLTPFLNPNFHSGAGSANFGEIAQQNGACRTAAGEMGWLAIAPLVAGELLVGLIYMLIGYTAFRLLERCSLISGELDSL